jgi:hypothetical protein
MNEGYSFGEDEQFSWDKDQLRAERFYKIKNGLHTLKALCSSFSNDGSPEDALFFEAMGDVLESLERTLIHHLDSAGHIVSPKSDEPWD